MMEFEEKYISAAENAITPNPKKVILSNDAYAVGEMINGLILNIKALKLAVVKHG